MSREIISVSLLAIMACGIAPANASTTTQATCDVGGASAIDSNAGQSTCNLIVSGQSSGAASGFALANYGTLKGVSIGNAKNLVPGAASTVSGFQDQITIFSQGLDGQFGFADIGMAFSFTSADSIGTFGSTFLSTALTLQTLSFENLTSFRTFDKVLSVNSNGSQSLSTTYLAQNSGVSVPFDGHVVHRFGFVFGQPFSVRASLLTSASAQPAFRDDSIVSALIDAGHSAYWDGLSGVTFNGGLVSFSTTSNSGTDWSKSSVPSSGAVPEPNTWAMMIVGFGLVGGTMRRRQSASQKGIGAAQPSPRQPRRI